MSQLSSSGTEINNYDEDDIIREFRVDPVNGNSSDKITAYGKSEITEAISEGGGNNTIQSTSLFSIDINNNQKSAGNVVYVAVGDSESSSDALTWALNHSLLPGTTLVYLVHIFSEINLIPSPMGGGWVHRSQVSRDLVENYAAKESDKRRKLLSKYIDLCNTYLVQVETILIEGDSVADAIVELISILNIQKLVLGISKSNLKKVRAGKWSGSIVADKVLQKAPSGCEIMIICQGEDIMSHPPFSLYNKPISPTTQVDEQQQQSPSHVNSFSCCFRPSHDMD